MRAVVVIIDVSRSMGMKDFKPSRLAAALLAVREFLSIYQQSTPIAMAGLAISSHEKCRIIHELSFRFRDIEEKLADVTIEENPGCFSF
jgi:hypothetical protein